MTLTVRPAVDADLGPLADLTAAHRARLSGWSPTWWRPAAGADALHPLWLRHLVSSEGPVVRVVDDDGDIVGGAVSAPQPGQWFVDDLVVAASRWPDAGSAIVAATAERPALTCAATRDVVRVEVAVAAGLVGVSSYWIGVPRSGPTGKVPPLPPGTPVAAGPPHTFGARLDPHVPGALALADSHGGVVVGSPSTTAPPVYDPGGTVCVIDRVVGADRAGLLDAACALAAQRGDVLVAVVAAAGDIELHEALDGAGLARTVDVLRWP